ncbi:hypothetical protein Syun_026818 [Stephania yunnanensis]|uniref:Protein kinase domain-containing protein n=1 Tax=Stephania yunnanensis TaxID=152371 RepID=A0AAP0EJI0_9MAGN
MTSWRSGFALFFLLITSHMHTLFLGETKSLETKFLVKVIRNKVSHGCRGLICCDHRSQAITEIRLDNMNLKGVLDVESLCKLSSLRVLDLANNFIVGTVPSLISNCMSCLTHFNELNLRFKSFNMKASSTFQGTVDYNNSINGSTVSNDISSGRVPNGIPDRDDTFSKTAMSLSLFLLAFCVGIILYVVIKTTSKSSVVKNSKQKAFKDSPFVNTTDRFESVSMDGEGRSEVALSIDEPLVIKMEDFLAAKAELLGESRCSSLYKVHLENIVVAVKRLKNLKVSIEEFEHTMRQIGNMRHPNILTLVAYHSLGEEKLLIYRYQRNEAF